EQGRDQVRGGREPEPPVQVPLVAEEVECGAALGEAQAELPIEIRSGSEGNGACRRAMGRRQMARRNLARGGPRPKPKLFVLGGQHQAAEPARWIIRVGPEEGDGEPPAAGAGLSGSGSAEDLRPLE